MRRHPLGLRHDILRQTWCFLVGHRWVSSWRRVSRTRRRGRHANPYYDHVATWHYKCRRCRSRIAHDSFYPWFKSAWWALKGFWEAFGIVFNCYWTGYPWRVRAALPVSAFLFGVEQGWTQWSCDRHWPFWPTELAGELNHRLADWIESHRPPDPLPKKKRRKKWVWVTEQPQTFTASSGSSNTWTVRFVA